MQTRSPFEMSSVHSARNASLFSVAIRNARRRNEARMDARALLGGATGFDVRCSSTSARSMLGVR